MQSKRIRDLIISLIILIISIKLLTMIGFSYISNAGLNMPEFAVSIEALGNMMIIGLSFLTILLIPFYLSKRSEEKKLEKQGLEKQVVENIQR